MAFFLYPYSKYLNRARVVYIPAWARAGGSLRVLYAVFLGRIFMLLETFRRAMRTAALVVGCLLVLASMFVALGAYPALSQFIGATIGGAS